MEFNLIFIVALLILLMSIIMGGARGLLKGCLSLAAFLLAGVIVSAVNPLVTGFLREHTGLDNWIREKADTVLAGEMDLEINEDNTIILSQDVTLPQDIRLPDGTYLPAGTTIPAGTELPAGVGFDEFKAQVDDHLSKADQSRIIEKLPVPQSLQESLEENNNAAIYQRLGVDGFTDYVSGFVSNMCLNIIGYVLTFLLVFFALHVLMIVFDFVDRLPVIHGINHFAGALLGIIKGLLIIEVLLLLLVSFSGTGFGTRVLEQIDRNAVMSALYHKNLLVKLLMGVISRTI